MGNDKRTLEIEGETLFNRALGVLVEVFEEVIVVLGEDHFSIANKNVRVVYDIIPNRAAAGGLYTGLTYATCSKIFVVACDMPFLSPDLIQFMASQSEGVDMTFGELTQGVQTMHAIYSKQCLPTIETMVQKGNLKLQELPKTSSLVVKMISEQELVEHDPHLLSFMNLNSPADFELARKIQKSSPKILHEGKKE